VYDHSPHAWAKRVSLRRPTLKRVLRRALLLLAVALTLAVGSNDRSQARVLVGRTSQPIGHYLFTSRGLVTQFERRGAPNGYVWGEAIQQLHSFDSVVGSTVEAELKVQFDRIRAMGVNEIWYQLRTADPIYEPEFKPPDCNEPPVQGLQWPQPTPSELANLGDFFDLVQSEGMRVVLDLNNTHMEEQPPTNAERWLGAILNVVKDKPALDLVQFDGTPHLLDLNGDGIPETCGTPAEAPLWLGPVNVGAQYVRWAIGYALSLGLPASKLTAESIVGNYFTDTYPPFWAPIDTMKAIFDQLGIPANERTYSLSLYEHRRCAPATRPPGSSYACTDEDAHDWADQSLRRVRETVGPEPRLFAAEFGALPPTDPSWSTEAAVESLSVLMQRYRVDGGAYWLWVNGNDADEGNPQLAEPVKRRGTAFVYSPVRLQLLDMYGFHLASIPNGSFENDRNRHGRPDKWTIAGKGTVTLRPFAGERSRPWRGRLFLRLASRSRISATSSPIQVSPDTTYTTTGDFRTQGTTSSVAFRYLTCGRHPSANRAEGIFPLAPSTTFTTVPLRYTTPGDACFVRIEILARHGAVDADNLH
jgi:hypothetical protein